MSSVTRQGADGELEMPMLQPECEINEETFDAEDLWLA